MRVTIIPADRMVYVDGDARKVDDHVEFRPGIHAVQWYHDHGEIEYNDGRPNKFITSLDDFKHHVVHHSAAVERDKKQADEDKKELARMEEEAKHARDLLAELLRRVEILESVIVQKTTSTDLS